MRVPREQFRRLSLAVHGLVRDVPLHDVTAVDLPGGGAGRTITDVRALMPESPRARAGGEPPRARPLRAARPAGTAVWLGHCEAHAPGDVVSPAAQQRHHTSFGAAPRCTGRPVPCLVRA